MPVDSRGNAARKICSGCGMNKLWRSYSVEEWERDEGEALCKVCQEYGPGNTYKPKVSADSKAFAERRDAARETYCHRWNGETLIKSCPLYVATCGEKCYREDDNQKPICFVEPDEEGTLKVRSTPAIDLHSPRSPKFGD